MPAAGSGTPAAPFSDVTEAASKYLRVIATQFVIMRNGRARRPCV